MATEDEYEAWCQREQHYAQCVEMYDMEYQDYKLNELEIDPYSDWVLGIADEEYLIDVRSKRERVMSELLEVAHGKNCAIINQECAQMPNVLFDLINTYVELPLTMAGQLEKLRMLAYNK